MPVPDDRKLRYLQRMGIDAWVRREGGETDRGGGVGEGAGVEVPTDPVGASGSEPAAERPATATAHSTPAEVEAPGWAALREQVMTCTRCPLHRTRTQGVFGVGSHDARLLIVGEAPGAEEDRRGEPFVGRAGQLLDAMLRAIDLDRQSVYITNILKSRPPNNRDPRPEEVAACEPYLRRQIELLAPALIVAVGRVAAQNLLRTDRPLGRLRGQWHRYGPRQTPLLATYHPAYLLRNPADKRKAWQDLKAVRRALNGEVSA